MIDLLSLATSFVPLVAIPVGKNPVISLNSGVDEKAALSLSIFNL